MMTCLFQTPQSQFPTEITTPELQPDPSQPTCHKWDVFTPTPLITVMTFLNDNDTLSFPDRLAMTECLMLISH